MQVVCKQNYFWCYVCVFSYWMMCKLCSLPLGSVLNLHSRNAAFLAWNCHWAFTYGKQTPPAKLIWHWVERNLCWRFNRFANCFTMDSSLKVSHGREWPHNTCHCLTKHHINAHQEKHTDSCWGEWGDAGDYFPCLLFWCFFPFLFRGGGACYFTLEALACVLCTQLLANSDFAMNG